MSCFFTLQKNRVGLGSLPRVDGAVKSTLYIHVKESERNLYKEEKKVTISANY